MGLRNEKRWLAEQARAAASVPADALDPALLSPAELKAALCAELVEAMKRILPALPPALQKYALDHSNQAPEDFADLRDSFPLVAGRRMAGLYEFEFARDGGPKPGDALLLRASPGSRSWPGPEVHIYGFSDGRVLEVSSEDGHFDDWENQHLTSAPTSTEDEVFLEAAGTVRDRAHLTELAASVGISAEDASRFFDQMKQIEAELDQKVHGNAEEPAGFAGSSVESTARRRRGGAHEARHPNPG